MLNIIHVSRCTNDHMYMYIYMYVVRVIRNTCTFYMYLCVLNPFAWLSTLPTSILTSDFTVHFGEIFTLRIVEWPESLKLQVYEAGLLTSTLLSEVFVPLPDPQQTIQAPPTPEAYQFTSNKVSSFVHAAVGSGQFSISVVCLLY